MARAAGTSALTRLVREIEACRICVEAPAGKALPHEPRPVLRPSTTARICICSQAPGLRVHKSGIPFTDPSGDRLRGWMGVTSEEFYDQSRIAIVPMGFCFPGYDAAGGDLPPRKECAPAWRGRLFDLMPQLELILLIGHYAQRWHLGPSSANLSATMRDWRALLDSARTPKCLPLPHPSWRNNGWLKSNPWFETEVLPRLRREIRARLEVPAAKARR